MNHNDSQNSDALTQILVPFCLTSMIPTTHSGGTGDPLHDGRYRHQRRGSATWDVAAVAATKSWVICTSLTGSNWVQIYYNRFFFNDV